MDQQQQIEQISNVLTLGLPKKHQKNDIQYYKEIKQHHNINMGSQIILNQLFLTQIKQNPQLFFNFGFNYADFKAYLMKMVYMRAVRSFIQKKRIQKIDQYNRQNGGGLQAHFSSTNQQQQQQQQQM